ncbi:MAG: NINE protein [Cyanobacteria bacterium P01_C01_bin.69]
MKNKVIAALLALSLGGIGLHKFYLGEAGTGFRYLFFSWTLIPCVLALLEGIALLTTSDQVFDARYNHRYLYSSRAQYFPETDSRNRLESTKDKVDAIGALKQLYDDDALTAEEYEDKRRKILDSI